MIPQRVFFFAGILFLSAVTDAAQGDIRKVDFKNFTYQPQCLDQKAVKVSNGKFSQEKQMQDYVDRFYFGVFAINYGDLDGDKSDEAIVLTTCNTGGTGNFSEGYVYKLGNAKARLAARITGGDRAYGGLRTANVVNGVLVVERNDPGENGANCCPEFIETQKYRLTAGKLVEAGQAVKRPIFAVERVQFDRGTTGKSMTLTVPANEGKRFIVGAKAGQRLSVSVGNPDAQIRLLEDAQITNGIDNFVAVLPKSGDYTVEISNQTDKPMTVILNIKIQ